MKKSNQLMRACVAAAVAGWSAGAQPAGFALMEQNASGLGNAYAGQAAAAENPSTIFFNPAGMTRLNGTQASGVLNDIKPSSKLTPSAASGLPVFATNAATAGNGGDSGGYSYVPEGYVSYQWNSNWWVGVGVSVPFGLSTKYNYDFVGRFQSREAEIKTYDINPSVAYKFNDWLSVGGGISYQHLNAKLKSASNILGAFEGTSSLDASDNQWGFNLGAMFNLGPRTRLGLSYRSVMSYDLRGTVQVIGPLIGTQTPNVLLSVRAPDTWSAALAHSYNDRWEVLGDFTWTNWSTIKDVPIVTTSASALGVAGTVLRTLNFQFKDSYRIGVGTNYKWNDSFTLKLGIAHDNSPVTDPVRLTALPDSDRTWLAIGGKYKVTSAGTVDFGYAHLFIKNGPISQLGGTVGPTATGNVAGTYKNKVDILSVQYTHAF